MCRYRRHQYCSAERTFKGNRCGPWESDRALRQHRAVRTQVAWDAFQSVGTTDAVGGLADGLQTRVPRNDRRCINYHHHASLRRAFV